MSDAAIVQDGTRDLVANVRSWLGDVLSPLERALFPSERLPGELRRAAEIAGRPVLAAANRSELVEALEKATDLAPWREIAIEVAQGEHRVPLSELAREIEAPRPFRREVAAVLGAGPVITLRQGFLFSAAGQLAISELLERLPELRDIAGHVDPLEVVNDPQLAPEIQALVWPACRSLTAALAIAYAIDLGKRLPPWLAQAVCEFFADGQRQALRFVASIPGVAVSPAILPASDRLDLEALDAAHRARVARYATWFESLPDSEKSTLDALAAEDLAESRGGDDPRRR